MPQSFADELRSFPMSQHLGESLERAHRFASEQSHRAVTLEHLLLALTDDAEAAIILESANVELTRLRADVSGYLGRLMEDMRSPDGTDPHPDSDLLRVFQAATAAAQQSKRRHIDGAIVLAAIVGDGKSPAAGLLKALGMTFEGAIRALQRANTQARLRPSAARSSPPRTVAPAPAIPTQTGTGQPPPKGDDRPPAALASGSSAEDFLAAARARIQQRAAANRGSTPAVAAAQPLALVTKPETKITAVDVAASSGTDLNRGSLAAAIKEVSKAEPSSETDDLSEFLHGPAAPHAPSNTAQPGPGHRAMSAQPNAPPAAANAPDPRGNETPQAMESRQPSPPSQQPGAPPEPMPFPTRQLTPAEGPRRPPLPSGPGAPMPIQGTGRPARSAQAPWPELGAPGGRAPLRPMPGSGPDAGAVVVPLQPRAGGPFLSSPAHSERGPLIENVPRRMRDGVPAIAEVRIARDKIDALMLALSNRGFRPEAYPTRTLAVRLRAPDGGFLIEADTPETQWLERSPSQPQDNFAAWQWTIMPQRRGRNRLLLTVSARLIGTDGLVAESAPSDRSIDVKVGSNYRRRVRRWMGWLLAMLTGAAVAQFGGEMWTAAELLIRQFTGG